jgi:phosphoribosylformimino-5-aminoimidazole carboxamide ribotide isomerase|tara:strand:- start:4738 stop:5466 length:729 start_codon:yes stop_codon:yes gene_type:complete
MKIFPAIDLKDGKCVRLAKGEYDKVTTYSDDPIMIAEEWVSQGSLYLHIIDLDGARDGTMINFNKISEIRNKFPDIYIQVGGGIRSIESINKYLNIGINKVIIGTKILSNPDFLFDLNNEIKSKIIVDLAIKNNKLTTDGWHNAASHKIKDFVRILEKHKITEIVLTDVNKDGMLDGINIDMIEDIISFTKIPLIASGGVSCTQDIVKLITIKDKGLSGVIIGKALYENKIKISDILSLEGL